MIDYGRYKVVETKEEFDAKYDAKRKSIFGGSFWTDPETISFPLYIEYCDFLGGDCFTTTKEKMAEALKKDITNLQKKLDSLP